jgi:hypothetical protein
MEKKKHFWTMTQTPAKKGDWMKRWFVVNDFSLVPRVASLCTRPRPLCDCEQHGKAHNALPNGPSAHSPSTKQQSKFWSGIFGLCQWVSIVKPKRRKSIAYPRRTWRRNEHLIYYFHDYKMPFATKRNVGYISNKERSSKTKGYLRYSCAS